MFQAASSFLAPWMPFITVIGIFWRMYYVAKKRVTAWAGVLLDNHLHHVQLSLDASLVLQREQIHLLKKIAGRS